MDISIPNEWGALKTSHKEIVARHGRSYAGVNVAFCEDGLYRQYPHLFYSYGGFCGPANIKDPGYATVAEAVNAGLEELLRRWHKPFPQEPQSVHDELAELRSQVETRIRQPSLF
ncbi:MAG: hypothetical protein JSS02_25810 [Planctomycetes bacterium]|nr:hypothetical protein [Planctomycetota bacterium]